MGTKVWKSAGKSESMLALIHVEIDGIHLVAPVWRGRNGRPGNVGQWEQVIATEAGDITLSVDAPALDNVIRRELVKVLAGGN